MRLLGQMVAIAVILSSCSNPSSLSPAEEKAFKQSVLLSQERVRIAELLEQYSQQKKKRAISIKELIGEFGDSQPIPGELNRPLEMRLSNYTIKFVSTSGKEDTYQILDKSGKIFRCAVSRVSGA